MRKVAQIPGTYCPALYDVEYTEQGDFKSITPRFEEVPVAVEKRIVEDVENVFYPTKPVVPFLDIVHVVVVSAKRECYTALFVKRRQSVCFKLLRIRLLTLAIMKSL